MSRGTRIGIILLGAVVAFAGWFLWTMEAEYTALGFVTTEEDGEVQVWVHENWDETGIWFDNPEAVTPEALEAAGAEVAFTGTPAEADSYTAQREEEAKNYLPAGLFVAAGAVLIVLALIPRPEEKEADDTLLVSS